VLFWKRFYFISPTVVSLRETGVIMTLSLLAIEGDRECQTRIAVRSTTVAVALGAIFGGFGCNFCTGVLDLDLYVPDL
jgi:hypothetical protein